MTGLVVSVPVVGSAPLCWSLPSAVTRTVSKISVSPGWINPFVIRECLSLSQVPVLVPRAASTPPGAPVLRLSLPPLCVFTLSWLSSLFYLFFFKVLVFSNPYQHGARTHKPQDQESRLHTEPSRHPSLVFNLVAEVFRAVTCHVVPETCGVEICFPFFLFLSSVFPFLSSFTAYVGLTLSRYSALSSSFWGLV